ncbi:MAG: tol-pal system-associated acyl-CoA thioesterase [Gammaproteobacteria bacterium WSBS_2016_MAG_OTU1]
MNAPPPFSFSMRVYYEDTDAAGVVYHASYVRFFERARTEFLRQAGFSHQQIREQWQVLFAVRTMKVEYLRPAMLDDMLQIEVRPAGHGRVYVDFAQTARREDDIIATATVRVVCVGGEPFRAVSLPSPLADIMNSYGG